ncbi:AraC family transcriptional regulator [Marinobacter sp. SS21]|uniref:AraC family transcriptional regulator n=1 Tax=Marinobacter sp. SS21 TaxID=2979460 RepID=UPI00232B253D|nr:AraC family transcriptional regulator [Marinobacter sp. SS21]MDC0663409.1 AraC family transcriptional regulator ligand-binding domain-containing protein [Marinobacter sp. SS21]
MTTKNHHGSRSLRAANTSGVVLAGLVQQLLIVAEKQGLSREYLLAVMEMKPEELADPNQLIRTNYLERLLNAGLAFSQDELLGLHLAQYSRPEGFGVAGYILQACSTIREAIEMCIRYEHLASSIGTTSLHYEPGVALWAWDIATHDDVFRRHAVDFLLGSLSFITRTHPTTSTHNFFSYVLLQHSPPASPRQLEEYERVFGCPVRFNQPLNALAFPLEALNAKLVHSNSGMLDALEAHARFLQRKNEGVSFYVRARTKLRVLLGDGFASREGLAECLGMSSRHLLRRLRDEGTTYRELVDELRLELALRLLAESSDSVESIAHRLQYTESQSFIRWFKSRKKMTPTQFRQAATRPTGTLKNVEW